MKMRNYMVSCPLQTIMTVVTKKWFLLVLNQIGGRRKAHYNELLKALQPISPKSLADVLKELQKWGLVVRKVEDGKPQTVTYSLNRDGEALRKSIIPLLEWASAYTDHENCPILSGFR